MIDSKVTCFVDDDKVNCDTCEVLEDRDELLQFMKENSYRKGEYTLSSGKKSEHYVNLKPVTLSGKGLTMLSFMLEQCIDEDSAAVAGLTLGADPLVSGVAMAACLNDRELNALIVRKEAKGHGTQAWIEGPLPPKGSKVTVLEDVVTTGGSSIKAVQKLRDAGYVVDRVVSIVDRQMKGEADINMCAAHLELYSLFSLEEFIDKNGI